MIISTVTIDDATDAVIQHFDSYSEELEAFMAMSTTLEGTHKLALERREIHSYFHKTTDHAELRTHGIGAESRTKVDMVVALVRDNGLLNKEWVYEDKEIQNSQGGTTRMAGWYLD